MQTFGWAKVGLVLAKEDPYILWFREVLEHTGIRYEELEGVSQGDIARYSILILCGSGSLHAEQAEAVSEWVRRGGHVICCGSPWSLETMLGISTERHHLSNAVAVPVKRDPLWPDHIEKVRFFGGELRTAAGCEVIARIGNDGVALSRRKLVKGLATYIAPHVGQTLKLMLMGRSVETDGIGPCDGSARLDDGVLRAEDGGVLDFDKDRMTVEGCDTPYFGYPYADAVREMLARAIAQSAEARGLALPLLWHWPGNATGAAMVTIEAQNFDRDDVSKTYRLLSMFGMPATWLVPVPGFASDVYRAMRNWGHEIGLLFHCEEPGGWNEEKLKIQMTSISRLAALPSLNTARAEDGRWKGWNTFYDLCESAGARVSVSKGGRQPGTSGFLFGTCHPFVPVRRNGTNYLTTEIPYTVYWPGGATPDVVAEAVTYQTASRHGCVHIAWPADAIASNAAGASLRRVLSICKQLRLDFLLPEQIHRFERARRQVRISHRVFEDEGALLLTSDVAVEGLTILLTGGRFTAEADGKELQVEMVQRYGATMAAVRVDLEAKRQCEVKFRAVAAARAA